MVSKSSEVGKLTALVNGTAESEGGFTGAQIAAAYKAALSDFVLRKTSRAAIAEVSRLLVGALLARRQELAEAENMSTHRLMNYY